MASDAATTRTGEEWPIGLKIEDLALPRIDFRELLPNSWLQVETDEGELVFLVTDGATGRAYVKKGNAQLSAETRVKLLGSQLYRTDLLDGLVIVGAPLALQDTHTRKRVLLPPTTGIRLAGARIY